MDESNNNAHEAGFAARQYLKQVFWLNAKIKANLIELKRLWEFATCIPSDLSKNIATGNVITDKTGNIAAKIADLDTLINSEISRYVSLHQEIREGIDKISDDKLRLILQKKYLNSQKWEEISHDLKLSKRHLRRLHAKALEEYGKYQLSEIDS